MVFCVPLHLRIAKSSYRPFYGYSSSRHGVPVMCLYRERCEISSYGNSRSVGLDTSMMLLIFTAMRHRTADITSKIEIIIRNPSVSSLWFCIASANGSIEISWQTSAHAIVINKHRHPRWSDPSSHHARSCLHALRNNLETRAVISLVLYQYFTSWTSSIGVSADIRTRHTIDTGLIPQRLIFL